MTDSPLRAIAFYLPQFHPVPENDAWWGRGFTEWRNVTRARPLFPGHYQPHLPADLGFYDLRLPEVRAQQAAMAAAHGIHGFCYYHYWFNGRRILERPFQEVLTSGEPSLPFCLCWANENWTRAWSGGEREVLLRQDYHADDDRQHIRSLLQAFADPRYIRVDGRPLFLVYRTELLPEPARTAETWRDEARRAGLGEIYLARVESFADGVVPADIGFDAAVEFAPDWRNLRDVEYRGIAARLLIKAGLLPRQLAENRIVAYASMIHRLRAKAPVPYKRFRCVTPGFDNTARRSTGAVIIKDSDPDTYRRWLLATGRETLRERRGDERLVFINAWNEWAEGNHLEPDRRFGHAFLKATAAALAEAAREAEAGQPAGPGVEEFGLPGPLPLGERLTQLLAHIRFALGRAD